MNLSQQLTDAIDAQNALTQVVADKMQHLDDRVERFVNQWGIDGYTTLEVGQGKPFASIQAAWDSLIGKVLKADVLIKVADGIHTTIGITLQNQPFAHRIRIEGNIANPAACQIQFIPDANKASHGIIIYDARNLIFSGFKLIGSTTDTNWTHRSLLIGRGSRVWSMPGSIQIEGSAEGLQVNEGGQYECESLHVENAKQRAVRVGSGGRAYLNKLHLVGPGRTVKTTTPAHINGDTPTELPHGLLVEDTGQCWASESVITDHWHGVYVTRNGYCWCDVSTVERCEYGFYAQAGGVCWTYWWGTTPGRSEARRPRVIDSGTGYWSDTGGTMLASGGIAERCTVGFQADQGSMLYCSDSIARNCQTGYLSTGLSVVFAWGASLIGCAINFSPALPDVPGNGNAIVRYQEGAYDIAHAL